MPNSNELEKRVIEAEEIVLKNSKGDVIARIGED